MISFKQIEYDRCRFCGYFPTSRDNPFYGFSEKFRCSVCSYHWIIDIQSKFMEKEIFFGGNISNSYRNKFRVVVNYIDNTTEFSDIVNYKIAFVKPKAIKFNSYKEINKFMLKYNILQ